MVRVRLTRKQTTSRPDDVWPDLWKHKSYAAKKQSESKVCYRETKARNCQTITVQGDGVPRHVHNRWRRTREVPNVRVCTHLWVTAARAGEEGRIDVLPWYRPTGVAKNLQ